MEHKMLRRWKNSESAVESIELVDAFWIEENRNTLQSMVFESIQWVDKVT